MSSYDDDLWKPWHYIGMVLAFSFGVALIVTSIAWPIVYYKTEVHRREIRSSQEMELPGQMGIYWGKKEKTK